MKKANLDELRPEYKRSDFGTLVRGKYATRASSGTNVVVLELAISKAFPNDKAVAIPPSVLARASRVIQ